MDTQLSILRIAAGAGLALGSRLMPELVEATRWSNIGFADMVAGEDENENVVRNDSNRKRIQIGIQMLWR